VLLDRRVQLAPLVHKELPVQQGLRAQQVNRVSKDHLVLPE
jgi:hypothetical protein